MLWAHSNSVYVLLLPNALSPHCVWVMSSEVSNRTPFFGIFRDACIDLCWTESRRLVLVHDFYSDRGCGGRHRCRKRRLICHHHQQSEDRNALKIQLLGSGGEGKA